MKDDKKKLAVVGALVCIVVGIGAFQFMKGSSSASTPPPPSAPKPATPEVKEADRIKNPEFGDKLAARNPFQSPNGTPTTAGAPAMLPKPAQPPRLAGNVGGTEVLPSAKGSIPPLGVTAPAPLLNYRLSGLILGRHPAAVFTDTSDKSGAQRLVPIGGSLDGDTQLIAISKGRAVVNFRGKHLRLTLGGTPDAN